MQPLHLALRLFLNQIADLLRVLQTLLLERGGKISKVSIPEVRGAIVCFQYVERIKPELIITVKLLERINALSHGELTDTYKLCSYFLETLKGEINIANNVSGLQDSEKAGSGRKAGEAADKAHYFQYEEAMNLLSEAMSSITTSGQKAAKVSEEKSLL